MSFTKWYRSTINRDGRVVWWEHVYAFVPLPTVLALFATRYWQTIWPTAAVFALSLAFALWSWRQDVIVHNTDDLDSSNKVRDREAKVPLLTKFYIVVMIGLAAWIVSQWFRFGHY